MIGRPNTSFFCPPCISPSFMTSLLPSYIPISHCHSKHTHMANNMQMTRQGEQENDESNLQGQAGFWNHMYGFVDSMTMKCACDLHIADKMDANGGPMSLSQIINGLNAPNPDINCLARIMRFLVRRNIFVAYPQPDSEEILYGLTPTSRMLLHDTKDLSLAPMLEMINPVVMASWYQLGNCVKEGGNAFNKAHGKGFFEFGTTYPKFNKILNDGMSATAKITMKGIISEYKDGFNGVRTLVDLGGGTGTAIAEVVKACPHVKGFNFDLPHVIATAPRQPGVIQAAGNMFKTIPKADAILMKWIMHDWGDEDCIKILTNCRKAIPEKTGKIIIIDVVLEPDGNDLFDDTAMVFDLLMIAYTGGKERTELEWKKLLQEGGFPRYKIIKIAALQSIIEAYPE